MAAMPEKNDFRTSRGTHGAMAGPCMTGRMAPAKSPRLLNSLRETLWSHHCHRRSNIRTREEMDMVSQQMVRTQYE